MSYVDSALSPGERVIYRAQVSIAALLPTIIAGTVAVLFAVAIGAGDRGARGVGAIVGLAGALLIGSALLKRTTTELAVTDRRVIAKFGFVSRTTIEITLAKLESVQIHQSVAGRMFGYGSIVLAGAGNPQAPIPNVAAPLHFRQVVSDASQTASASASKGQR